MLRTVKETAEYLNVSENTVWNLLKSGKLRRVKVGRLTRVDDADIIKNYLKEDTKDE